MGRRKAPILQQKGSRRSRLDVFSTADEDQAAEEEADPIAAAIEAKKKRRGQLSPCPQLLLPLPLPLDVPKITSLRLPSPSPGGYASPTCLPMRLIDQMKN